MTGPLLLSLEVAALATALAGTLGVGLGAVLARRRGWLADTAEALTTAPLVLPPTVLGYWLLTVLGRESALGRAFEAVLGGPVVFTVTGAVIAASVGAFPLVARTARAAFEGVDERLVHAARTLGAGPWRAFWAVELPLARRGVLAGLVLGWARALGDFGATLMVAGNLPGVTQTAALALYDAVLTGRDADAQRLAGALSLLAALGLLVVARLSRRGGEGP